MISALSLNTHEPFVGRTIAHDVCGGSPGAATGASYVILATCAIYGILK
jgi:hypothetical protein